MHSINTDYAPISYYDKPDNRLTGTMQYLHWFRFYVRNSDDFIRVPTPDSDAKSESNVVRLFFIMHSTEGTFIPAVYEITSGTILTYLRWRELIRFLLAPIEKEINKVLKKELRGYLAWSIYEFIGWTTDGFVQNPEENKEAFRFTGHLTSTLG